MFGADATTNQTQTSSSGTLGLGSSSMPTPNNTPPTSSSFPTISSDTSSPMNTTAATTDQASIPEFVPPDSSGHISTPTPDLSMSMPSTSASSDLKDIKKEALTKLGPLVDKMDQKPEDKFKTIMMLIQASDDQSLVHKAYDVANAIEDESARARALLDIINEINYFTNQTSEEK